MDLRYVTTIDNSSGLGRASRDVYNALSFSDVIKNRCIDVKLKYSDEGEIKPVTRIRTGPNLKQLPEYDVVMAFSVPHDFKRLIEEGKINIGYTMWETDSLEDVAIEHIQALDALIVPCKSNVDVFKQFNKKTFKAPVPYSTDRVPYISKDRPRNEFRFYSIYEWTERKSPLETLEAYYKEFDGVKDVKLTLKIRGGALEKIPRMIFELKDSLQGCKFPPVELIIKEFTDKQIENFHRENHCYVSLSKGEGWGLPIVDAYLCGNSVIATHPNGCTEYLNKMDRFYPVTCITDSVQNMEWFPYMTDQHKWLSPDIQSARDQMRAAYESWKTEKILDVVKAEKNAKKLLSKIGPKAFAKQMDKILKSL